MKTLQNIGLQDLYDNLQEIDKRTNDYLIQAKNIFFSNGNLVISKPDEIKPVFSGNLTETANYQLSDKLDIPFKYLQKCYQENEKAIKPFGIYDYNLNYWLKQLENKQFLIRTIADETDSDSGLIRAILSNRYKIIDNLDLVVTCLKAIKETDIPIKIDSADLTNDNMFIRFVNPESELLSADLLRNYKNPINNKSDNGIITGFIISNSETGKASYNFYPRIKFLACNNGLIRTDEKLHYVHLGSKSIASDIFEFSNETKHKELELIQSELKDMIKTVCSQEYLNTVISEILEKRIALKNPVIAVGNIASVLKLSKTDADALVNHFIYGNDLTSFGLMQSVTSFAQTKEPETRYKLESVAYDIFNNASDYDTADKQTFDFSNKRN